MSLLTEYLKWTADEEAPERFHLFAALTGAAHCLGRRVWVPHGKRVIYPGQTLTLLLGPSGLRKTSAASLVEGLLQETRRALPKKDRWRINVMAERGSTQGLIDDLVPKGLDGEALPKEEFDCAGFLYAPEMAVTFGSASYVEELTHFITRAADGASGFYNAAQQTVSDGWLTTSFKKDKGQARFKNPTLTMLACATPTHLRQGGGLPPQVKETGFLARLLTIYEERSSRPPQSHLRRVEEDRDPAELVRGFALLALLAGKATLTAEGERAMDLWYAGLHERLQQEKNTLVQAFLGRAQTHVIRLALTLAAIEAIAHPKHIILDERHFGQAITLVERIERDLPRAFTEMVAGGKQQATVDRVRHCLSNRWVVWRRLCQKVMHARAGQYRVDQIEPALDALIMAGEVVRRGEMRGRTKTEFRLAPRRANPWLCTPAQAIPDEAYLDEQDAIEEWAEAKEAGLKAH